MAIIEKKTIDSVCALLESDVYLWPVRGWHIFLSLVDGKKKTIRARLANTILPIFKIKSPYQFEEQEIEQAKIEFAKAFVNGKTEEECVKAAINSLDRNFNL